MLWFECPRWHNFILYAHPDTHTPRVEEMHHYYIISGMCIILPNVKISLNLQIGLRVTSHHQIKWGIVLIRFAPNSGASAVNDFLMDFASCKTHPSLKHYTSAESHYANSHSHEWEIFSFYRMCACSLEDNEYSCLREWIVHGQDAEIVSGYKKFHSFLFRKRGDLLG